MKKLIVLFLVSILSTSVFAGGSEGGEGGGTGISASHGQTKI